MLISRWTSMWKREGRRRQARAHAGTGKGNHESTTRNNNNHARTRSCRGCPSHAPPYGNGSGNGNPPQLRPRKSSPILSSPLSFLSGTATSISTSTNYGIPGLFRKALSFLLTVGGGHLVLSIHRPDHSCSTS